MYLLVAWQKLKIQKNKKVPNGTGRQVAAGMLYVHTA